MREARAVILAAGKSTRMKIGGSKLLLEIGGKAILKRVVEACEVAEIARIYVVVGHNANDIIDLLGNKYTYVFQDEQLGTAHALMQVKDELRGYVGDLVVSVGDSPYLTKELVQRLLRKHQSSDAASTLITALFEQVPPYARVIRNSNGKVISALEENLCTDEQKKIGEVVTSHYCFRSDVVLPLLAEIKNDNPKREYYLTDIVGILTRYGYLCETLTVDDPMLVFGINDLEDLVRARGMSGLY
jgi:bifunctional UDP-N-acetylglucosamine pyrophosphorylase/glucosamine-1-phosphate N-acetyltransferase